MFLFNRMIPASDGITKKYLIKLWKSEKATIKSIIAAVLRKADKEKIKERFIVDLMLKISKTRIIM